MSKPTGPRILIYDIETSLQSVLVFGLGNNDWIDPENIVVERHLISVAWKWYGEPKVFSVSLLDDPKRFKRDIHDDKHVASTFHKALMDADVIVGHNSDRFDLPYCKTRMLYHGLPALPPINSIDTYKTAKSELAFNSNKLDYIGKFTGVGQKVETSKGLWKRAFMGDVAAIKEMVSYNKQDVLLGEAVYTKLIPFMKNHINRELFGGVGCPKCGSSKVQSRGKHVAISRTYQRFHCQACGGWFRSVVNDKEVKPAYRTT